MLHQIKVGLSGVAVNIHKKINMQSRIVVGRLKEVALLPTAHCLQDLTAPALGRKVDLLANILSLCN